ncbi:ABC transporter permease [Dyella mobilis]|uniref:ABC transporter permease n=1 Tax=Dyella mobilis TaxID=1849582 RepID=A0ABS2KJL7_9GAMM|nr:ABC transporter permease [Dyella mobilis]MBM7131110.1 ABC transporter permease [Dyella mobilis]GLQ98957.1 ABC transporter ATP-binding protein [Dyella mobilis]
MFAYYLRLGLRSLRRNPLLTLLMVVAIGFGVAASMTAYAVLRATSNNPIPQKSSQLFAPQIDNAGPPFTAENDGEPSDLMSYIDTMALMQAHRAQRQTALYSIGVSIMPADAAQLPFQVPSYAGYADTFAMFDIPFLYGSGWSAAEDQSRAAVAVIGRQLNDELFHGANSVGRNIVLDGHSYRIVGVMNDWNPQPVFYDVHSTKGFTDATQLFIPFTHAIDLKIPAAGVDLCNVTADAGWDAWLHSECTWINYWVELPDRSSVTAYRNYLQGYAAEQQRAGRFKWAPNIRLRNVTQWLDYEQVVPPESKISLLISLGFFVICLVNTVGLLLAKFMRRAPEIGVRRALGASRRSIYAQFLVEAGAIGLSGGVLGVLMTGAGVLGIGLVFDPSIARLATLDLSLAGLTLGVAVFATVLAAFYPAWRAARVQPSWQLKSS